MKDKYVQMYMKMAIEAARCSLAIRYKVGCVIVTPNDVVGVGLNGTPPFWETNVCETWTLENGLVTKPIVRHAERAAIKKLTDEGVVTSPSTAFVTLEPCFYCAERLYDAGVIKVIYLQPYRCHEGIEYLNKVGIEVEEMENYELRKIYSDIQIPKENQYAVYEEMIRE